MPQCRLVTLRDSDLEAMIAGETRVRAEFAVPPGGVDDPVVLDHVRAITARLLSQGCDAEWMIVANGEIVGLCGHKNVPADTGEVEIGYGVAASRRRLGYATQAVAAMLELAKADPAIQVICADTATDNIASHRVLERNGFTRTREHIDPEDGTRLIRWEHSVRG
jgi:RimJ/RimL family protein N-acetyltransferase